MHFWAWILKHFFSKKWKIKKMKKCVSTCKYRYIVRVAMSKKMQGCLEKNNEKNNDFSVKNRWKIDEKMDCSTLLSKNRENSCPGRPISIQNRFFGRFWLPWGTQKSTKLGDHHWSNTFLEPTWDHFRPQITFLSILAPILGAPGPHFGSLGASV